MVVVVVAEVVVVDAAVNTNCLICFKKTSREIGKACKTCGMILEDSGKDFCSKICRTNYIRIRRKNN